MTFSEMKYAGLLGIDGEFRDDSVKWVDNHPVMIREASLSMLNGELKQDLLPSQLWLQKQLFGLGNIGKPIVSRAISGALAIC